MALVIRVLWHVRPELYAELVDIVVPVVRIPVELDVRDPIVYGQSVAEEVVGRERVAGRVVVDPTRAGPVVETVDGLVPFDHVGPVRQGWHGQKCHGRNNG